MRKFITDRKFYVTILSISIPIVLQNLIFFGISMADTVMIGRLGDIQLSGVAQANQLSFFFQMILCGIAGGGAVLVSQYWGAKNTKAIRDIISMLLRMAAILTIVLSIVAIFFPEQIMSLYLNKNTDDGKLVLIESVKYLRIIGFSYLFIGITMVLENIIRSVETVKISVISSAIALVINVILNWVFIFGKFGMPAMGVKGAALSTLIVRIVEFAIIFIYVFAFDKKLKMKIKDLLVWNKELFKDFLKYSTPVLGNEIIWGFAMTVQAALLGKLSSQILAAQSIACVLQQLAILFAMGLGSAASVVVGKKIGEKDMEGAKDSGHTIMLWSFIIAVLGCIVVLFLRVPFINIYNISDEVRALAMKLTLISAILVLFSTVSIASIVGVLRGAGDTKFCLKLEIIVLWGIAIPFGFIAALVFDAHIIIVYILLKIDEPIKAVIAFIRTRKDKAYKVVTRN